MFYLIPCYNEPFSEEVPMYFDFTAKKKVTQIGINGIFNYLLLSGYVCNIEQNFGRHVCDSWRFCVSNYISY